MCQRIAGLHRQHSVVDLLVSIVYKSQTLLRDHIVQVHNHHLSRVIASN